MTDARGPTSRPTVLRSAAPALVNLGAKALDVPNGGSGKGRLPGLALASAAPACRQVSGLTQIAFHQPCVVRALRHQ